MIMKKQIFLFAVAALALASCSSENDVVQSPDVQQTVAETGVNFDVYVGRGLTRAGKNGVIDNTTIKAAKADGGGFGVFGYYTNGESYTGSSRPDFFYNQGVFYDDGDTRWEYEPIKYWPNEFGADATSDQVDRVTLFAYAPWVDVEPLTGLVKVGTGQEFNKSLNITGMTRNNATGDPLIKYVSSLIAGNSVDLCYGVAAQPFTSSNSAINQNDIKQGNPYIDVVKPGTDANSKIYFDFKHATAQLVVTIDAKVVNLTDNSDDVDDANTRIWVRSVSFEGITQSGALNLNSTAESANWYDVNGTSLITTGSLTVHDGRKDGREANEAASSETPATLNPQIVQNIPYSTTGTIGSTADLTKGVKKATVNLFGKQDGDGKIIVNDEDGTTKPFSPIFVIPTKEKMKVTIVYDVETADENLATYLSDGNRRGSTIENRIYKTIDAFGYIEAGKKYTLNLHLGMRSVDFEATVTEWDEYQAPVDLPSNLQTFAAKPSASPGTGTMTIPAAATTCQFAVSGLEPGAVPTYSAHNLGSSVTLSVTPADGYGVSTITVNGIDPYTSTINETATGWINVQGGGNSANVYIKRTAAPLNFTNIAFTSASKLTLTWSAENPDNTKAIKDLASLNPAKGIIKVFVNSIDVTANCTFGDSDKTITLGTALADKDKVKIILQANDAPIEIQEAEYTEP